MLGAGAHRVSISVVPLPAGSYGANAAHGSSSHGGHPRHEDLRPTTLLVLGKRQVCEQLSVQGYARSMRLTPAETQVLELLCAGVRPTQIARLQHVAVSTVRTQLGAIRNKTGAASISDLVRQVAVLPPLLTVLRGGTGMGAKAGDAARPGLGANPGAGSGANMGTHLGPTRGMGSIVGAAVVAALGVAMGAGVGSALAAR